MCVTLPALDRDMGGLKQTNPEEVQVPAEGLHASKHRSYKRSAPETHPKALLSGKEGKDVCRQCGATETPQWRNGPLGPRTLCNACGIRLHRQSQRSGQPYLRVKKKITKFPVRMLSSVPSSGPNSMHRIKNEAADDSKWPNTSIEHPTAMKQGHSQEWRQFAVHGNFTPSQGRPKRKAAVAAVETTRKFTQGLKKGQNNTWVSNGTHTVVPLNHQHAVPLIHTARVRGSIEPVDFTGAVDLVGLSRASTIKASPGNTTAIKLEELGQDLLSHLTEIPQAALLELQGIECELLSAHWEMQASEMALKAVAKVLKEQKEETIKKKTRYWRARDRLEKFIHTNQSLRKRSDK